MLGCKGLILSPGSHYVVKHQKRICLVLINNCILKTKIIFLIIFDPTELAVNNLYKLMTLFYTWNTFKIKFVLFYMLLYKPWKGIYTFNKFLAKCGERECLFIKCFCCTVLNWCKSSLKFILWTCSRNGKSCAPWVSLKWKNGKEKKIALSQSCTISLTILKEKKICTLTKWPTQEELILVSVAWSN